MHLIITFGDCDSRGDPHTPLPLAGPIHRQPQGHQWGRPPRIGAGGSLRLL